MNLAFAKLIHKNNLDCPNSNKPCFSLRHNFVHKPRPNKGFTLIEVVIAIAIFSMLALGANALLNEVIERQQLSDQRSLELEQLQRAMLIMERDFLQMQDRIPRSPGLDDQLVVNGGEYEYDSEAYGIKFIRGGWQNPQLRLKRSHLQNVVYRLQEGRLERLHTNYVDSVIGEEPKVRVLLSDIADFKIEMLTSITKELKWSEAIENTELPIAVAVTITHNTFGEIRRVYKVKA